MKPEDMSSDLTPLPIVATVSRLVSKLTDRVSGDRSEFPLLVAAVAKAALEHLGEGADIFYGSAAWIEIMDDQTPMWVGCWGEHVHLWLATKHGEVVDLTVGVSYRKKAHKNAAHRPKYSPPLLWSRDVPLFYRYKVEGIAEFSLDSDRDKRWYETCVAEIKEKLPSRAALLALPEDSLDFPEEAMLCPNRKILDDAGQSFKHFDRALLVHGIPPGPF